MDNLCIGNRSRFTAESPYNINGGAASYVCLPDDPTWATYKEGIQDYGAYISGTESVTIMIPRRTKCYPSLTLEYTGYLMTGHHSEGAATDYACVDSNPEAVYHGEANLDGKVLYFTEVKCGSLPCQEYPDGREIACVVSRNK
ncbi:hypothetical protein ACF0H5_015956 [Mactra antiquata]